MSNMTREALEKIYSTYNIVFLNIQKEAAKLHVDLEIDLDESGRTKLIARDRSNEDVSYWYEYTKDEDYENYSESVFPRKNA